MYGGIKKSSMLFGIQSDSPCSSITTLENDVSGYCFDNSSKKMFIHSVLQYGTIRKLDSPIKGSTAPYT